MSDYLITQTELYAGDNASYYTLYWPISLSFLSHYETHPNFDYSQAYRSPLTLDTLRCMVFVEDKRFAMQKIVVTYMIDFVRVELSKVIGSVKVGNEYPIPAHVFVQDLFKQRSNYPNKIG